MPLQNYKKSQ